ncbi:MAG: hypothetical protein QOE45_1065 [Frankiaceae bacterium]|jgi:hypothetical protein|nr:hypothetical protein [Frankiaceae bacterium]
MKQRLLRLALGASVALAVSAPMAPPAHAFACNKQAFPEFCAALDTICQHVNVCRLFG